MRELACWQQLVDHNITYEGYQWARNNARAPSNVDLKLWNMYRCDSFNLSSLVVMGPDGIPSNSYFSGYNLQGTECYDCVSVRGRDKQDLHVLTLSSSVATKTITATSDNTSSKIMHTSASQSQQHHVIDTYTHRSTGNETFPPTPAPTSPTPYPTPYPTNAPVIMNPSGHLCKIGDHTYSYIYIYIYIYYIYICIYMFVHTHSYIRILIHAQVSTDKVIG